MKKFMIIPVCLMMSMGFVGCRMNNNVNRAALSVYMDENISESRIQEIGKEIEAQEGVYHIELTTADEAWDDFKSQYFDGYESLAEGFKDDNPLVNCDSYSVYISDTSKQDTLVKYFEGIEGVRQVNRAVEIER